MAHNRKLVIGVHDIVKNEVPNYILIFNQIRDEYERLLIENNYFVNSPFRWIDLVLVYGNTLSDYKYSTIDKVDGELFVQVELPVKEIELFNEKDFKDFLERVVVDVLLDVAKKYELDTKALKVRTEELYGA